MPSVINTNLTSSSAPSELDFVADDAVYFNSSPNSTKDPSSSARTVQDLKDSNRRRWSDPEDEFSVPIYTEHPLITKKPLNMSSFLLNYRAMHRSIEIMTPPAMQINDEAMPTSSMTTSPLHPTIPDGPIYIHHRSTTTGCALSNVVSCSHIHCFEHNRQPYSIARPTCQKKELLSPASLRTEDQDNSQDFHLHSGGSLFSRQLSSSDNRTSSSSSSSTSSSSTPQEHSFLESHIASIGQWLSANAGSA